MPSPFETDKLRQALAQTRQNLSRRSLFEYMPAFSLSHACIVTDLTPIVTIDRRVG
jgi:hypothetical protein